MQIPEFASSTEKRFTEFTWSIKGGGGGLSSDQLRNTVWIKVVSLTLLPGRTAATLNFSQDHFSQKLWLHYSIIIFGGMALFRVIPCPSMSIHGKPWSLETTPPPSADMEGLKQGMQQQKAPKQHLQKTSLDFYVLKRKCQQEGLAKHQKRKPRRSAISSYSNARILYKI